MIIDAGPASHAHYIIKSSYFSIAHPRS